MLHSKKIIVVGAVIAAIGISFFLWTNKSEIENSDVEFGFATTTLNFEAVILGEGYVEFTHPTYGFSIEYPEVLEAGMFKEGEGSETIIFHEQDEDHIALEDRKSFQIFVTPFDEGSTLTLERIREDLPFVPIEELVEVVVGIKAGNNTPALIFWSEDEVIGRTREVWFTHGGYLYEITTFAHMDTLLAEILSTLTFKAVE